MRTSPILLVSLDRPLLNLLVGLLACVLMANWCLVFFHTDLASIGSLLRYVIHQCDLNVESNFATWCSSMLLLLNAL